MAIPLVCDTMSSPVISIPPMTRLPVINRIMGEHALRHLPVIDGDRLVGIISRADVRNAVEPDVFSLSIHDLGYALNKVRAIDIMRPSVVTIEAQASLGEAARKMLDHRCGCLPVVAHGHLVGMLTKTDILRAVVADQATYMRRATPDVCDDAAGTFWPVI